MSSEHLSKVNMLDEIGLESVTLFVAHFVSQAGPPQLGIRSGDALSFTLTMFAIGA